MGEGDPLAGSQHTPLHDPGDEPVPILPGDLQPDHAIGEEDLLTDLHIVDQMLIADLDRPRFGLPRPRHEPDVGAVDELHRAPGKRPDPQFRPLDVLEESDHPSLRFGRFPNPMGESGMELVVTVREVEASNVHPRPHQRPDTLGGRHGRTEGGDDLREAIHVGGR